MTEDVKKKHSSTRLRGTSIGACIQAPCKLVDLRTFGGPFSRGSVNGSGARLLNNTGVVSSYADFAIPDLNAPDLCFDPDTCLLAHAAKWGHHRPIDLGALDNSYSSAAGSINDRGWSTSQSQTGLIVSVPIFPDGFPQLHAALWRGRRILDLDTRPQNAARSNA